MAAAVFTSGGNRPGRRHRRPHRAREPSNGAQPQAGSRIEPPVSQTTLDPTATLAPAPGSRPVAALRAHLPEYLSEALGLGIFMVSAALCATLLEHPGSPVRAALPDPTTRRALMGLAMGLTGIVNVYSPWGRRSGGHLNPALTLVFLRLGKVAPRDALGYVIFQFAGGLAGLLLAGLLLGAPIMDPAVRWVVTTPGDAGVGVAFAAEVAISFVLMTAVLFFSNHARLAPFTGVVAGVLLFAFITLEAPLSGMSMNPARTFASALPADLWAGLWIYFTAPLLGMALAAEVHRALRGTRAVACAKLHHDSVSRCIFHCDYHG